MKGTLLVRTDEVAKLPAHHLGGRNLWHRWRQPGVGDQITELNMLEKEKGKMGYRQEPSKLLLPHSFIKFSDDRILRLGFKVRAGMLPVPARSWTYRILQCKLDIRFLSSRGGSFPAIDPIIVLVH